MLAEVRNGDAGTLRQAVRQGLEAFPNDPGLLAWSRLVEPKVLVRDAETLSAKVGSLDDNRGVLAELGDTSRVGAVFAGASGLPGAAIRPDPIGFASAMDLRGAAAPVQEAGTRLRLGDARAAEQGLIAHLERSPQDAAGWRLMGLARLKQRNPEGALLAAERALTLSPRDGVARGLKIRSLLGLERWEEAEAEASRALELVPDDVRALIMRAEARAALGKDEERLADLQAAAEIDGRFKALFEEALGEHRRSRRRLLPAALTAFDKRAAMLIGAVGTALLLLSFALYGRRGFTVVRAPIPGPEARRPAAAVPQGFRVVKTLGQGGMGVVYEAVDVALQRTVALKRMRDEVADNPRERARFLKEARLVAGLRHPNIVEIFSIHESPEGLFLVFEKVPGQTLHERLGTGALPRAEAIALLRQVAAALDHAHAAGVVHQDLKPANIMAHAGQVKVMDFGIARRVQETLSTMSRVEIAGTPAYMAPEQELGADVGPAADLFSFGVCAYEVLTGKLPFPHGGMAKAQGLYRPMADYNQILASADAVVSLALSPEPGSRPPSAARFIDELARTLAATPPVRGS